MALAADPPLTWTNGRLDDAMLQANGIISTDKEKKDVDASSVQNFVDPKTMDMIRADLSKINMEPAAVSKQIKNKPVSNSSLNQPMKVTVSSNEDLLASKERSGGDVKPAPSTADGQKGLTSAKPAPANNDRTAVLPAIDPFAPEAQFEPARSEPRDERKASSSPGSVLGAASSSVPTESSVPAIREGRNNEIVITDSKKPTRGVNIRHEMPSVRHITMSPGNKWFGGDDVEIAISPIFDIVMQMPDPIEWFNPSSDSLTVSKIPNHPTLLKLKLKPIENPVPMSLQIVDVNQKIWTFTVVGVKADLATEYPKTLIVNKKIVKKTIIGARNPQSIINALPLDYAVQMVVGDQPNTSEFQISLLGATYMHHEGYATYMFSVARKDGSSIEKNTADQTPNLKFTLWSNNRRIDGGGLKMQKESEESVGGLSRDVEWTVDLENLSKSASKKNGRETLIVICQVRASILDLEDWRSAFITVSDSAGYTRFDFQPYSRDFRAPNSYQESEED
jgi:hypothetical protein